MAKRTATSELNHDNWDAEEESEDPGTFTPLSSSELKNRVIKKARRTTASIGTSRIGISPFANFSGFSSNSATKSDTSNSFFKKSSSSEDTSTSLNIKPNADEKKENGKSNIEERKEIESTEIKKSQCYSTSDKQKPTRSIEYFRQLQSLNESIMKWMQFHLSKNSCCDFTPVFNDYKRHLDTLNVTYPVKNNRQDEERDFKKPSAVERSRSTIKDSKKTDAFGTKTSNASEQNEETDYGAHFSSNTTNTSTFSFGIKKTPTSTSTMSSGPTSSFEEENALEKKPFQFSFGVRNNSSDDSNTSKPFSFASSVGENTDSASDDVEYIPPKNDFVAVKEEDSFYSKRCKLFVKKGDGYTERGVGNLYLKPLDGKTQLLIRADTNLGNILLNIILSASLPLSRTGKNNVLLVCVPNPPIDSKADSNEAIPFLIRVKTSEDADELLETLNKHKS